MAEFKVDKNEFDQLSTYISKMGYEAEKKINQYLEEEAFSKVEQEIKALINIGKSQHSSRQPKGHAKTSKSIKIVPINLGFIAKNEKKYGYLYFPDDGAGTSKKEESQNFFEKGILNSRDFIIKGIEDSLIKKIGGE